MRHWKIITTSFATLCARLSSTAALLIINGVAARRMTRDEFGLWAILLSLNLLTNGFDLGFQFTLGNRLAALGARGAAAEEERRETYLSIIFLETAIYLVDCLVVLLVFPLIPWAHWFKITDPLLAAQVVRLMPVVVIVMMGTLPIGLVWTVFFAYQEIKLASFLSLGGNIVQTIVFVAAAHWLNLPSLTAFSWIVLTYFAYPLIYGAVLTCYVFIRRKWRFGLLPPARVFDTVRSMARVSFHAFFLTISGILSMILGPIISGFVSGLTVAGDFTLLQKLFSFLVSAHLSILAPVSPAVTLESRSGNWDAVRRRLRVCVFQVWPAVFLVGGAAVWASHPLLIRLWAGHALRQYPLAALLLLWACLGGFINTFSVFLNSLGLVKMQAGVSFAMMIPSLLLPAILSRWLGVQGIALSMVICTLPGVVIWPLYTRRALRLQMQHV
jgi:O-antigen/teichoic acid export membrane protein